MYTVYAKQDGTSVLFQIGSAPTLSAGAALAKPYRACAPQGWRVGIVRRVSVTEPTPDFADVLAKWKADVDAGVDKNAPAKERDRQRYEHRKRLVEEGLYKWSDFDLDADDGYDDDEDDEG